MKDDGRSLVTFSRNDVAQPGALLDANSFMQCWLTQIRIDQQNTARTRPRQRQGQAEERGRFALADRGACDCDGLQRCLRLPGLQTRCNPLALASQCRGNL